MPQTDVVAQSAGAMPDQSRAVKESYTIGKYVV